jgi:lysozyme family protein
MKQGFLSGTWVKVKTYFSPPLNSVSTPPTAGKSPNFELAVKYVLSNEGGYEDQAQDTPTNFGITLSDLAMWRKGKPITALDVKNMKVDEAEAIYKSMYWDHTGIDLVQNPAIAIALFDQGVLAGIKISIQKAQAALYTLGIKLTIDGVLGPQTLDQLNKVNTELFIKAFTSQLISRYDSIVSTDHTKQVYYKGWINRVNRLSTLV